MFRGCVSVEKRSLYSLVHLPLADGQEEERASLFQEIAVSSRVLNFHFMQPFGGSSVTGHVSFTYSLLTR